MVDDVVKLLKDAVPTIELPVSELIRHCTLIPPRRWLLGNIFCRGHELRKDQAQADAEESQGQRQDLAVHLAAYGNRHPQ